MIKKINYMIKDKRMPYYLPANYLKGKNLVKGFLKDSYKDRVKLVLSFDIESNFGILNSPGSSKTIELFLDSISKVLREMEVLATFFIQGDLIELFPEKLKGLADNGHELGLHGYKHENWGYDWFVKGNVPAKREKKVSLNKGLLEFEKHQLPRPVSFRAPYMVIDNESIELLKGSKFLIDILDDTESEGCTACFI